MTEEDKLIKEATETVEWQATPMVDRPLFVHGYVTGAKTKLSELDKIKKENEQKVKDDARKYAYSKAVSNHIKYISRDSDVVRKIHNLVALAYIHGAENKENK